MRYAVPKTTTLAVTDAGRTYTKEVYLQPTTLTGVTDESHPAYDPGATYNTGDYVIVPDLKTIYRCAADGVSGVFPPSDPTKWVDFGFVNSYRMLATDEQIGAQTEGSDIVIELPFSRSDTFALLNAEFESCTVRQTDDSTGDVVFERSYEGRIFGATSFSEYFFGEEYRRTRVLESDLMWLSSSTLRIEFTGSAKIGTLIVGKSRSLGCTLYGTQLDVESRSKVSVDEITGFRRVVRYGSARVLQANLIFDTGEFDSAVQKLVSIVDRNILFIPSEEDRFSEMTNIGYIERSSLPIENPQKMNSKITIIGVM